uniref:antimicrobial peptide NK-lysin isoform X1 n=1 Tax=Monopterus albus TaxID=43700 RepID=UPI0009B323F9|nr:antimicrobial peptide NK-lysin-like isoform X1 [Monopterus albus]UIX27086.1 antimicrobial protein NK-lysin-1 [Monopterus albus]
METSSVLLVCILVTCSVWTVHGRTFEVSIDDQKQVDVEISVEAGKRPGLCWACKWALNKVKAVIGPNTTTENITTKLKSICDQLGFLKSKTKLKSICDQIGLLKSMCRKFVTKHLQELIEELTTTDDVRTICVNTRACK